MAQAEYYGRPGQGAGFVAAATERFSSDTAVLAHAAQALPVEESLRVMRRLRMLEPSNAVWTVNLAGVYAQAVRDAMGNALNIGAPRSLGKLTSALWSRSRLMASLELEY